MSIGVGSYGQPRALRGPLQEMAGRLGTSPNGSHGTYFPYRLRRATADGIFVVGDAAGMCFALTGEGIRPAMFFGEACGEIIRHGLDEGLSVEVGLAQFEAFVHSRRTYFDLLTRAQLALGRLPSQLIGYLARVVAKGPIRRWAFEKYRGLTPRSWVADT